MDIRTGIGKFITILLEKINERRKLILALLCVVVLAMTYVLILPAFTLGKGKTAELIPILTYHKIVPAGTDFESGLLIAEDTFDAEMKYLHDEGYKTLTLDEFYDWYKGEKDVPEKSVVITFDDGYYGTYYLAYPIIRKYGQAATVFCIGHHTEDVTAEWDEQAGKDHYIGVDVIEKVREEYPEFSFESHTYDMHRKIGGEHPVDVFSYDQMKDDTDKNGIFGFKYLAYPWGDNNETFRKVLADSGYKMAFGYRPFYYATRSDDQYAVNRIKISGKLGMEEFKKIVNCKSKDHMNPDTID